MLEGLNIFLSQHKLENFMRTKMTGDASLKKFERLTASDRSLILCQIPCPAGETMQKIINISTFLQQLDLSAPRIYASDPYSGFLLLEDFGNDDFLVFLQKHKNSEVSLYKNAIDVLIKLQNQTITAFPQVEFYSKSILLEEVRKFTKYYIPCFKKLTNTENMLFEEIWDDLLGDISCELTTLVLRDYHSPNLFYLPQMSGLKKVGIIDLEDAMMGNMAYDVVSLLQDARYSLPSYHANALKDYYMQKSPLMSNPANTKAFNKAYYTLGLQRSLKVLGFVMYAKQQNHVKSYMHLIPLAKKYINLNLSKLDKASAVKHWLAKTGVLELI